MSFAVRPTFKPRINPAANLSGEYHDYIPDQDETKQIIMAIQKFKQKSSHESLINPAELQTILRKSSVNPEINPLAREGVESMLRGKEVHEPETVEEMLGSNDGSETYGFSSLSVSTHRNGHVQSRLQKELEKELGEIRERCRIQRGEELPEEKPSTSNGQEDTKKKELAKTRRAVAYGFPAQAALARGFVHRNGGMQGAAVRKTPLGIADSF